MTDEQGSGAEAPESGPRRAASGYLNMGTSIALGAALGLLLGTMLGQLTWGLVIGCALGVVLGAVVEARRPLN
jgi:F0F1-type ATP synthase assembly protein I